MLLTVANSEERRGELRREQTALATRLTAIKQAIKETGITKNAAQYIPHRVDPQKLAERDLLVREQLSIEGRLRTVKEELRVLGGDTDFLYEVLRDSLTPGQIAQLTREVRRRRQGEAPTRVELDPSGELDQVRAYKALAQELLTKMEAARLQLTDVIREGCGRWGAGEFLKFISPANLALPPLEDLHRLKRLHHLK